MHDNPWVALFQLAERQHGTIARSQAVRLGIEGRALTRRARSEEWRQPHRGVFVVPGTAWGTMPRLSASLLAVGPHAAITGTSALYVHGVVERPPPRLTLVVPHSRRAPRLRGVNVTRSRTLQSDDVVVVHELRCATPARAFLDAAPAATRGDLRAMLIDARQRSVVDPSEVIEHASRSRPRLPGRQILLAAAADVSAVGADSALSYVVYERLVADGLRPDPHPVPVDVGGRRLHPDITFADARVCIECDSFAHHSDQRAIDLDHRKDQAYSMAGWCCLRVGWRRVDHDWSGFSSTVRHALDEWPRVQSALGR